MFFLPEQQLTIESVFLISAWGGIVKCMNMSFKNNYFNFIFRVTCQIFKSCFIGLITALICMDNNISTAMTIVISGISGNMSDILLKLLRGKIKKHFTDTKI